MFYLLSVRFDLICICQFSVEISACHLRSWNVCVRVQKKRPTRCPVRYHQGFLRYNTFGSEEIIFISVYRIACNVHVFDANCFQRKMSGVFGSTVRATVGYLSVRGSGVRAQG